MSDFYRHDAVTHPARRFAAITPADAPLLLIPKALYIGGAGNLVVYEADGSTAVTFKVPAGIVLPIRVSQVRAATTATGIVGLF